MPAQLDATRLGDGLPGRVFKLENVMLKQLQLEIIKRRTRQITDSCKCAAIAFRSFGTTILEANRALKAFEKAIKKAEKESNND